MRIRMQDFMLVGKNLIWFLLLILLDYVFNCLKCLYLFIYLFISNNFDILYHLWLYTFCMFLKLLFNCFERAFPLFASKFPDQSAVFMQNLDVQKRKLIEKDLILAGLTGSIQNTSKPSSAQSNLNTDRKNNRTSIGMVANQMVSRNRPPLTVQNEFNTGEFVWGILFWLIDWMIIYKDDIRNAWFI